ncbi:MAG: preprotein translocase subunit SecY [Clostridia bacterium]|nr:preprotein translocase subunit SecY [Clostridia bacterium]
MFKTLRNAWSIPDLRKKMLYTLLMIFIFRLGSFIPVPGLNASALKELVSQDNSFFGLLDNFSGGSFSNATIFAMGITPYINSSIIMQLLTVAIPALERLSKEGEEGRKVIAKWTRVVTVVLALVQGIGMCFGIKGAVDPANQDFTGYLTIVITFTAGTAFLMWLGEQITQKGVGNGISIIIFSGIVASIPSMGEKIYTLVKLEQLAWWGVALIVAFIIAMIAFVVFITDAERRVPVQYAKRMVGRKMYGGQSSHIPLKVAMAGVIPIIFAMSILSFPSTIMQFTGEPTSGFWATFWGFFKPTSWVYAVLYFLLIIFFTYFYTAIQFNPVEVANNMKKNGGFVPGIRPGKPTSDFISRILSKITLSGAFFLGVVAIIPVVAGIINPNLSVVTLGGTSMLIMVGVALETVKQIESQMLMRHYKGFLD